MTLPKPLKLALRVLWPGGKWRWPLRAGVAFLGFSLFTLISVEITSQSAFCNSCHIMNSYYASWQHGDHQHVDCIKCHIPPGVGNYAKAKINGLGQVVDDLLSRTSGKPSAEIADGTCARSGCHDLTRLAAKVNTDGKFKFNHGKHLGVTYGSINIHCTTCHSHISTFKHFEVNTNACIVCHLAYPKTAKVQVAGTPPTITPPPPAAAPQASPIILASEVISATPTPPDQADTKVAPSNCINCHNAPSKPIEYRGLKVNHAEYLVYGAACESCHRHVTAPAKKVKDEQCFSCHDFGMERHVNVPTTHRIHSQDKKVECFSCHGVIEHGPSAQSMQLGQIDCQSCHQGQHQIQQNTYNPPASTTQPSGFMFTSTSAVTPMFMAHVSCNGCHVAPRGLHAKPDSGATVASATADSCDSCHKQGLGRQMIPLWQKSTHSQYDGVIALLPRTAPDDPAQRAAFDEARKLLDIVRLDGSWGVHNPRYTSELLTRARQKLLDAGLASPGLRTSRLNTVNPLAEVSTAKEQAK
jgi:nitrate/TMAO reductase-like tetraheme cytochrome c subunit